MCTETYFHDLLAERILKDAEYAIDTWTLDTGHTTKTNAVTVLVNFENLEDRLLVTQTVPDGKYIILTLIDTVI